MNDATAVQRQEVWRCEVLAIRGEEIPRSEENEENSPMENDSVAVLGLDFACTVCSSASQTYC